MRCNAMRCDAIKTRLKPLKLIQLRDFDHVTWRGLENEEISTRLGFLFLSSFLLFLFEQNSLFFSSFLYTFACSRCFISSYKRAVYLSTFSLLRQPVITWLSAVYLALEIRLFSFRLFSVFPFFSYLSSFFDFSFSFFRSHISLTASP